MPLCAKRLVLAGCRLARFCARRRSDRGARCVLCYVRGAGCATRPPPVRSARPWPALDRAADAAFTHKSDQERGPEPGGRLCRRGLQRGARACTDRRLGGIGAPGPRNFHRCARCPRLRLLLHQCAGRSERYLHARKHAGRSSLVANSPYSRVAPCDHLPILQF